MRPRLLRTAFRSARSWAVSSLLLAALLGESARAEPFDHLDCYKVTFKTGAVTLDIEHARQSFALRLFPDVPLPDDAGCTLRPRWPKEICVPVDKSPRKTPSPVGVDLTNAFLCYRMRCDADLNVGVELEDQFSSGTFVARGRTRRVCVPAQGIGATPTPTPSPTPTPELLLLNEVNPNIMGGLDLIELLAAATGDVAGFTIEQDNGSSIIGVATLPSIVVSPGDRILVHLGALDSPWSNEGADPSECVDPACVAGAWDVKGAASGLAFSHRVLLLRRAGAAIVDAVAFIPPEVASPPLGALERRQDAERKLVPPGPGWGRHRLEGRLVPRTADLGPAELSRAERDIPPTLRRTGPTPVLRGRVMCFARGPWLGRAASSPVSSAALGRPSGSAAAARAAPGRAWSRSCAPIGRVPPHARRSRWGRAAARSRSRFARSGPRRTHGRRPASTSWTACSAGASSRAR